MNGWALSGTLKANHHWQSGNGGGGRDTTNPHSYITSQYSDTYNSWRQMGMYFDYDGNRVQGIGWAGSPAFMSRAQESNQETTLSYQCPDSIFKNGRKWTLPSEKSTRYYFKITETKKPKILKDYETHFTLSTGLEAITARYTGTDGETSYRVTFGRTQITQLSETSPAIWYIDWDYDYPPDYLALMASYVVMTGSPAWTEELFTTLFGGASVDVGSDQYWTDGYMTSESLSGKKYNWKLKAEILTNEEYLKTT